MIQVVVRRGRSEEWARVFEFFEDGTRAGAVALSGDAAHGFLRSLAAGGFEVVDLCGSAVPESVEPV